MKHKVIVPKKLGDGLIPTRIEIPRVSLFRWGFFVNLLREIRKYGYKDFSIDVEKPNWFFRRVTIFCQSYQTARFISNQLGVF